MRVLSIEFTDSWSWGLVFNEFKKISNYEIKRFFMKNRNMKILSRPDIDVYLVQNVTLLNRVKEKIKTVCRLGGNRSFEGRDIDPILERMSKCFALIATNNGLYQIAKSVNENTYLIPNGLNLDEWKPAEKSSSDMLGMNNSPLKSSLFARPFTVGFCGNISTEIYKNYKGYDFVFEACKNLGVELKTALYKNEQIPHEKMQELFYSQIDCIVHPTLGEGCSNTLMEASACGVPIITTREAGYHGEMMQDGIDVLFCERSTASVQSKISMIKDSPELQKSLSANARKFAENHHDVKKIALQYEEIFQACHEKTKTVVREIKL